MIIDLRQRTEETVTYSVTNLQAVKSFLAHRQEGAFGIEYYGSKNERKTNFFAHYLAKVGLTPTRPVLINQQATDVECYSVVFKAQSFMPFRFRMQEDFWQLIDKYTVRHLDNGAAYLQIVFQYVADETWKQVAHAQYNAYLDGIEMPSSNESIRKVQQKLSTMLRRVRKKPYAIPQVMEKQEKHSYYVSIRLLLQGDRATRKRLGDGIKLAFGCTEYANGWQFKKAANTQEFLTSMQMRIPNRHLKQILCPDEMMVFFGGAAENEKAAEELRVKEQDPVPVTAVKEYNQIATDDTEFIEELTVALKRLKLLEPADVLEILDVKEGPTLKFVTFRRPENLYLSKIKPRLADLEVELSAEGISLERGAAKGSLSITLPRVDRTVISLKSLINSEDFKRYAESAELPFILGVDMLGEPLFADLVKLVHMLTAGQTGSGKSVFLSCLLTVLTLTRSPEQLHLYLIDPKRVELSPYKDLPHVKAYTPDAAPAVKILNRAIALMEERYMALEAASVKNITEYNKKYPDEQWPYIVMVMDEFGDLKVQVKHLDDYVERLAQKARAAGIHMILATQRPESEVVSGLIKVNLPAKVGFSCSNDHDYRTIFDGAPPFRLLGRGDGAFSSPTNTTPFTRFQAPFDQDETMFQQALCKWDVQQESEEFDVEEEEQNTEGPEIDEKKEQLKRIICETGETRVGKLRELTKMNQNKLSDYMKQLTEEGWLEPPVTRQEGYKLLLTNEQREEYLKQFQTLH